MLSCLLHLHHVDESFLSYWMFHFGIRKDYLLELFLSGRNIFWSLIMKVEAIFDPIKELPKNWRTRLCPHTLSQSREFEFRHCHFHPRDHFKCNAWTKETMEYPITILKRTQRIYWNGKFHCTCRLLTQTSKNTVDLDWIFKQNINRRWQKFPRIIDTNQKVDVCLVRFLFC